MKIRPKAYELCQSELKAQNQINHKYIAKYF